MTGLYQSSATGGLKSIWELLWLRICLGPLLFLGEMPDLKMFPDELQLPFTNLLFGLCTGWPKWNPCFFCGDDATRPIMYSFTISLFLLFCEFFSVNARFDFNFTEELQGDMSGSLISNYLSVSLRKSKFLLLIETLFRSLCIFEYKIYFTIKISYLLN